MSNICSECDLLIDRRKLGISCAGFCDLQYHATCVGISPDILKFIKTPGLHWFCNKCDKTKNNYETIIKNCVEAKINEVILDVKKLFSDAKNEIMIEAHECLKNISLPGAGTNENSKPLYSKIASTKSMIIVKPKNAEQPNSQTKSDIMKQINPIDLNVKVSKVKNTSNGGVLIGYANADGANKFKQAANEKLSENYHVNEVKNVNPRVKIVGMIEEYSDDQLLTFIKTQNDVIGENSKCNVRKIWPTKKNRRVYQAILEMDAETYFKLLELGNLFVNYDVCAVYDAIELRMCYKCSGFNHSSNNCNSNKTACPQCSLEHDIKSCPANFISKCINCVNAKILDCNHSAWDTTKCPIYKRKLEHYKSSLFSTK